MTKNFIITTILGIFIIYGCSQKAQENPEGVTYNGESFPIADTVSKVKCTNSGGLADQGTCFCPSNHILDQNGFCAEEDLGITAKQ